MNDCWLEFGDNTSEVVLGSAGIRNPHRRRDFATRAKDHINADTDRRRASQPYLASRSYLFAATVSSPRA